MAGTDTQGVVQIVVAQYSVKSSKKNKKGLITFRVKCCSTVKYAPSTKKNVEMHTLFAVLRGQIFLRVLNLVNSCFP